MVCRPQRCSAAPAAAREWLLRRQPPWQILSQPFKRSLRLSAPDWACSAGASGAMMVPSCESEVETKVKNSRFIGSLGYTPSVESARAYIAAIKERYPDARHHCYAFAIGHGASVTHGMSDDGEPSGTAGRPILAVLSGSSLGDCTVVVTRYSGGTKLGTGGLVKAYTESAQACLLSAEVEEKVDLVQLLISNMEYNQYGKIKVQLQNMRARFDDEMYDAGVTVLVSVGQADVAQLRDIVREGTSGQALVEETE